MVSGARRLSSWSSTHFPFNPNTLQMLIIKSILLATSFLTQVLVLAAPISFNARAPSLYDNALFGRADDVGTFAWIIPQYFDPTLEFFEKVMGSPPGPAKDIGTFSWIIPQYFDPTLEFFEKDMGPHPSQSNSNPPTTPGGLMAPPPPGT